MNNLIHDVVVRHLSVNNDSRGWLADFFNSSDTGSRAARGYLSLTKPGVVRGPHQHANQDDIFCVAGPSDFLFALWDLRPDSPTYGVQQHIIGGESQQLTLFVPRMVAHGYRNIGDTAGMVVCLTDREQSGDPASGPDEIKLPHLFVPDPHRGN